MQFLSIQNLPTIMEEVVTSVLPRPSTSLRIEEQRPDVRSPFEALLSRKEWTSLPAAVRRRFSETLTSGDSVVYRGIVKKLNLSPLGWLLAQGARIAGAPLPFDSWQEGRAAVVAVTGSPGLGGQVWTRLYGRRDGFPQVVHSAKRFAGPTGLEELVHGGVGMALTLKVEDNSLLFCSAGYFLTLLGTRLQLPRFLSPGALIVGHHDLGDGAFAFTLDLHHPWFGRLIHQTAHFHDMEDLDQ